MEQPFSSEGLMAFIEVLENKPTRLITFERSLELMTAIGFRCRLVCHAEEWTHRVTVVGPPSSLSPLEVIVETPWSDQKLELRDRPEISGTARAALEQLRRLREDMARLNAESREPSDSIKQLRELEEQVVTECGRFTRSGSFKWPMDRFELSIELAERSEKVTVFGPGMALLADAFLASSEATGVGVSDLGKAVVKLLTEQTVEHSTFHATHNRASDEALRAAAILRGRAGSSG